MDIITREKCCVTGEELEPLYSFKHFPIHMSCTDAVFGNDIFADMEFGISPKGVIQLTQLLPLDVLYEKSHGSGSVGAKWQRHHSQFAAFIEKFRPKKVLEIGAGHGILSSLLEGKAEWTIIEPDPTNQPSSVKVLKGYFDDSFSLAGKYDCIVHSHFFEHLYEPNKFLSKIFNESPKGTKHIFTLPNFNEWFKNFDLNTLNFEHTVLFTADVLDYLLLTNGFKILEKREFEDHSLFYATETDKKVLVDLPNNYEERKNHFLDKSAELSSLMKSLNESGKQLFLYGGHIFSQFAIGYGLDANLAIGILDNDPNKHNKRLYGTNLTVQPPMIIGNHPQPKVLLKVGRYKDEIIKQLLELNPEVEIVS